MTTVLAKNVSEISEKKVIPTVKLKLNRNPKDNNILLLSCVTMETSLQGYISG